MSIFSFPKQYAQKTLADLKSGALDAQKFYVHDWNRGNYGAPLVALLHGCECWNGLPYLIMDGATPNERAASNSRYTLLSGAEIRDVIIADLESEIPKLQDGNEASEAARWAQIIKENFPKYKNFKARLEMSEQMLQIIVIDPIRWKKRGMGIFLEDIQQDEVSISKQAVSFLRRCTARSGLNGMEIFNGPIIAGMFGINEFFSPEDISAQPGSVDELIKISVVG